MADEKKKYICSGCGYIYDPEKGDATQNVAPGTVFKDLPEDWLCPICKMKKEAFNPI